MQCLPLRKMRNVVDSREQGGETKTPMERRGERRMTVVIMWVGLEPMTRQCKLEKHKAKRVL